MSKILILLLYLFFITFCAYPAWNDYNVRAINNIEGLPDKHVNQILQDSDGFMWFATNNGLCRYDGYEFKTYKSSSQFPELLQSNIVNAIVEDIDHNLWIGTEQGLHFLDKSTDKIVCISNDSLPNSFIHSLLISRDSTLWVGTQVGLLKYNRQTGSFFQYKNRPNDETSIAGNSIHALLEDKSGDIWVGTFDNGICRFDVKKQRFYQYPEVTVLNRTNFLLQDTAENIWICNWGNGVSKMNNRETSKHARYTQFGYETDYECIFKCLQQLPDKNILVGTNQGLYRIDNNNKLIPINTDVYSSGFISNEDINDLFIDNQKNIWIATANSGVYIAYKEKKIFTNYPMKSSLEPYQNLKVNALYEWNKNVLLLGVDKIGFSFYDKKVGKNTGYKEISKYNELFNQWPGNVQFIFKHPSKKELWFGTQFGGLIICQLKDREISSCQYYLHHLGKTKIGSCINSIISDKDGNIWIGSDEGLNIITTNNDTLSYDTYNRIQCIYQDHTGTVWLGTYFDGLYSLASGSNVHKLSFKTYNSKNKLLVADEIMCIYEDKMGNLWIGTNGYGLQKYNQEKDWFEPAPNIQEIPSDIVFNITEVNGTLVLGTNKGVVLYNSQTHKSLIFDDRDGMLDKSCLKNSMFNDKKGQIYYGTPSGFCIFHPNLVNYDSTHTPTIISDFKIFHKSFDELPNKKKKQLSGKTHPLYSKNITLTSSDNNIGIKFAALSYVHPEKKKYAYKLEGFDKDWIYTDATSRTAFYTNLPSGEYRFLVKTLNEGRVENENYEEFGIKVLPPFYKTNLALVCYLFLITISGYVFYRFQNYRYKLKEAVKVEQIERIKAEELHQSKFKFFANISHEFLTPLSIISCSIEELKRMYNIDNKILKAAQSNTIRLNRLIEEILDFQKLENNKLKLNISYGDISSFVCNLCQENFALLAKNKNVSLCMQSEPEHIAAWFDTNKIDKILYNLLSNATKFSYQDGRGKIEILLKAEDQESEFQYKTLLIKIRNIGKGIATDELPYIFNRFYENSFKQLGLKGNGIGLALTKSLVELHKGTISVTSELEEWTEFTIRIPINKTSYSNEQINETIEHRFIVNDSPEGAAIQQSQSNSEIQKSSKQNSVLVIEDDQDLRDSLQRLLQEKYTISMAANGEEGLKLVQEIKPDLILSDVMMPIMDGFELCKQLKRKKETSCIPIILLTAKINDKDYLEGLNCGADAYITKPFNFNVLQANIDMVISNRKRVIDSFKSNPLTQNIDITISSYDEKFLKEAMDIVKKNMENPEFDVKHFCEIMQVSNSMLYRKLKSLANMSPNEFIRSIRLNTAKELIKQRRGNVSDIAYLVGFKDAHYFSVCFKKEFNMTPGEYIETICS